MAQSFLEEANENFNDVRIGDPVSKPPSSAIFFGADRVGIITHVKTLSELYVRRGFMIKRCWLRSRHSFAYIISQMLMKLGFLWVIRQSEDEAKIYARVGIIQRYDCKS